MTTAIGWVYISDFKTSEQETRVYEEMNRFNLRANVHFKSLSSNGEEMKV